MANVVETLGKLERRVTISVPRDAVQQEVDGRLRQIAKTFRMPGFRPGKAPMKVVASQYGGQVQAEVLSDKVGSAFFEVQQAEKLKVAGQPRFEPKVSAEGADEAAIAFDATFEVYPEITQAARDVRAARRRREGGGRRPGDGRFRRQDRR